jgi:hypothetical protein
MEGNEGLKKRNNITALTTTKTVLPVMVSGGYFTEELPKFPNFCTKGIFAGLVRLIYLIGISRIETRLKYSAFIIRYQGIHRCHHSKG